MPSTDGITAGPPASPGGWNAKRSARRRFSATKRTACRSRPSALGGGRAGRKDSTAWVRQSIPAAAVARGGRLRVEKCVPGKASRAAEVTLALLPRVGDDAEVVALRTGAGGGRDRQDRQRGRQARRSFGAPGQFGGRTVVDGGQRDRLRRVQSGPAAQRDHRSRLRGAHESTARVDVAGGGIRVRFGENLDRRPALPRQLDCPLRQRERDEPAIAEQHNSPRADHLDQSRQLLDGAAG